MAVVLSNVVGGVLNSAYVTPTYNELAIELTVSGDPNLRAGQRFLKWPVIQLATEVSASATTATLVSNLTRTILAGERIRFWPDKVVTISSNCPAGTNVLNIVAPGVIIPNGNKAFQNEDILWVTSDVLANATSVPCTPTPCSWPSGQGITLFNGVRVVLSAGVSRGVTTLPVVGSHEAISSGTRAIVSNVSFKKTADTEWRMSQPLWRNYNANLGREALYCRPYYLEHNTAYTIRAVVDCDDEAEQVVTATGTTWNDNLVAPETLTPTHYIDYVLGNDTTGDGSSGAPWKTPRKAIQSAPSNAIVRLKGGTGQVYPEPHVTRTLPIAFVGEYPPVAWNLTTKEWEPANTANWATIIAAKEDGTPAQYAPNAGWIQENHGVSSNRAVWKLTGTGITEIRQAFFATNADNGTIFKRQFHWNRGSSLVNTLDKWADYMYTNDFQRYGVWCDGAGTLYIRMQVGVGQSDNPNDYYWRLSGGAGTGTGNAFGYGLNLNGPNMRVSQLVLGPVNDNLYIDGSCSDVIVDRNLFAGGQRAIALASLNKNTYSQRVTIQENLVWEKGLWSEDQVNDPTMAWAAVKQTIGSFNQAVTFTGQVQGKQVVVRNNTIIGKFDVVSGSANELNESSLTSNERYSAYCLTVSYNKAKNMMDDLVDIGDIEINIVVNDNILQKGLTGLSTVGHQMGPAYYHRNIVVTSVAGQATQANGTAFQLNNSYANKTGSLSGTSGGLSTDVYQTGGRVHYNHNTVLSIGRGSLEDGNGATANGIPKMHLLNNVWRTVQDIARADRSEEQWFEDFNDLTTAGATSGDNIEMNFLNSTLYSRAFRLLADIIRIGTPGGTTKPGYRQATGSGEHTNIRNGSTVGFDDEIQDTEFVSLINFDLTPKPGSFLIGTGVPIPNLSDIPYVEGVSGVLKPYHFLNGSLPTRGAVETLGEVGTEPDPDPTPPPKPTNPDFDVEDRNTLDFNIDAISGVTGYSFEFSTVGPSSGFVEIGTETGDEAEPDITIDNLTPGATYWGRVRAYTGTSESPVYGPYSNVTSVTMPLAGATVQRATFKCATRARATFKCATR